MAQRRRHSRRKRRGRFGGLYRFLAVLAVIAAVIAACVIFFRVNEVTVLGNSRYVAQEVIDASGVQVGDNLMALSKNQIAYSIRTQLPYVESVSMRRRLPDTLEITVRERVAAASVESGSGPWLISSQGKLLEPANGHNVVEIIGLKAQKPVAGSNMEVKEEDANTLEYVLALLTALEEKEMLSACETLDCSASSYITLTWDIYTIKLPRGGDYAYMLRLIQSALGSDRMPQDQPGTMDLTVKDGELYFKPSN